MSTMLTNNQRYAGGTRKELKQLLKKACPTLGSNDFENIELSYWNRICINADRNRKKIINMDAWRDVTCEINNIITKNKATRLSWWTKQPMKPSNKPHSQSTSSTSSTSSNSRKRKLSDPVTPAAKKKKQSAAPKQAMKQKEIDIINKEISDLIDTSRKPFVDQDAIKAALTEKYAAKKALETGLKRLVSMANASAKYRQKIRSVVKKYKSEHPDDMTLIIQDKPGRPNVEKYYPHFSCILMDIVNEYCATDPKRRSNMLIYCDTLPQFLEKVKAAGFDVVASTLYYRLLPRRANTIEGRRHVATRTIPVQLFKPKEDDHGHHPSKRFCLAQSRQNKQLAGMLGNGIPNIQHSQQHPIHSFYFTSFSNKTIISFSRSNPFIPFDLVLQ